MHPANAVTILRAAGRDPAASRTLQRRRAAGDLLRVRHGVYVEAAEWEGLDERSRHLVRMRAVLPDLPVGSVFSHDSAAAIHGVPRLDGWPERVHVTVPSLDADRYRTALTLHAGTVPLDGGTFHGVRIQSLAATTVEVALRSSFCGAVVALDHAVRHGAEPVLPLPPTQGARRVEAARAVCDPRHESVGESFLAARNHEIGGPEPVPQHEFVGADGQVDRVDFWVPSLGLVIEFDGRQKYEDPAMLGGRSGADVLWDEKRREDRVRARPGVERFVRVRWWHLVDPERLRTLYREHGVPCR